MTQHLDMEPLQLFASTKILNSVVEQTNQSVPTGSVDPVAADPISEYAARVLTAHGEELKGLVKQGLYFVAEASYWIDNAALGIKAVDDGQGTSTAGPPPPVESPSASAVPTGGLPTGGNAKQFAAQLGGGDHGTSVSRFANDWTSTYLEGVHRSTANMVDGTRPGLAEWWKPTGATVAKEFGEWLSWYAKVGDYAKQLGERAATYHRAFIDVELAHPTVSMLETADRMWQQAARSGNAEQIRAARAYLERLQRQAREAQDTYRTTIESGVLGQDAISVVGPPPRIVNPPGAAADNGTSRIPANTTTGAAQPGTNRTGADANTNGATGNGDANDLQRLLTGLDSLLNGEQNTGAAADPAAAQPPTTSQNATNQNPANASGIPSIPPGLSNPNANGLNPDDGLSDFSGDLSPLDNDYPLSPGGYGGTFGGGPGLRGANQAERGGSLVGHSNPIPPKLANPPQFNLASVGRSQTGQGGAGYPYMPMAPMGGAGMGNGNGTRGGNPFEDKRAVVDVDAERAKGLPAHTVGEKQVVAQKATEPTRLAADHKSATNDGGTTA